MTPAMAQTTKLIASCKGSVSDLHSARTASVLTEKLAAAAKAEKEEAEKKRKAAEGTGLVSGPRGSKNLSQEEMSG